MRRLPALLPVLLAAMPAAPALAQDSSVSPPSDLSVTIYRDPNRNGGTLSLDALGGFAVVTETRRVTLPAGRARLRFVGVVDGIIPESAIITGLPGGVIEKNQDAALLSPAALLKAMQGKVVQLQRTSPATGKKVLIPAQVVSASDQGVVFDTPEGKQALRCSGLPEMFRYDLDTSGLSAQPVLSVQTRASRAVSAVVKLTYLAQGFDWNASYTAQIDPQAKQFDLGSWITLANANSVSLENAQVQIVAGGLKREAWRKLVDGSARAVARCWGMQRTDQVPRKPERPYQLVRPYEPPEGGVDLEAASPMMDIVVTAQSISGESVRRVPMAAPPPPPPPPPPAQEQLGDLKLYRLSYRTTVAARQMKQTRLLDKEAVPFDRVHTLTLDPLDPNVSDYLEEKVGEDREYRQPLTILRTRNDKAHNLGVPLPAGAFMVWQPQDQRSALIGQPSLRDSAEDEKIELGLGASPDIQIARRTTKRSKRWQRQEVTITNALPTTERLELRLATWGDMVVEKADAEQGRQDGQTIFKLDLEPNSSRTVHFTVKWK